MVDLILKLLPGLAIAIITSWLTVYLSIKRFRSEKWWEKKAETYSSLLSALHDSKSFAEVNLVAEKINRDLTDIEDEELRAEARESEKRIYKEMDVGAFYLSNKAIRRLHLYKEQLSNAGSVNSWAQYLLDDLEATDVCIKDIIEIAKKDLHVANK